jgi:hypothetical protein
MVAPKTKGDSSSPALDPQARQLRGYYAQQVRALDSKISKLQAKAEVLERERGRLLQGIDDIDNPSLPFVL